ncbi:hypothetical protein K503DRAFT_800479 [Rhizopogon vinicolor AM-OR11-026]|uniref:Meiotically up-regulated protein Msb1/Mug8 domain-containing protein n=1 Tax=Rhizopogon vinicolor AM-OR11-026 TaxID=1314800 RepID=A0A1B7N0M2_9AGAM|nr:hypothetical protein K503DRAFT_800479 [Rhizopogon vinicolor AM-OR11-026]
MPSFLNKVFGRKTSDDRDQAKHFQHSADHGLLEGKYEAVSTLTLPGSNTTTLSKAQAANFSLFRPKSRIGSPQRRIETLPQLSLQLPSLKDNTDSFELGVFEVDLESQRILDDSVIGAKLLSPLEALILVRACAQAITERGLETLGIMHPHWHSASPDIQRKLISLFIHSLAPKSRTTTLSPTPTPAISAFNAELEYTRSPHDVAAVLRWGLRHLVLQNNTLAKDASTPEWAWYKSFFDAEREASYPPKSFTDLLLPQLPQAHVQLLIATIDIISALASHAEANSISGSKLSKFLGLWVLSATRSEQNDNWDAFYARWERAGRILEHLFLSRIREENFNFRLPTRLQELVQHYPYSKGSPAVEDDLLPRPRFSTRTCDVLFVRIETLLSESAPQPKSSPVHLLLDAFNTSSEGDISEHVGLWNALKTAATESASKSSVPAAQEGPQFGRVFVDETIQLIASMSPDSIVMSPVLEIASPVPRRSSPFSKILERSKDKAGNGNGDSTPISPITQPIVSDWAQFSTSGFGETGATTPLAATLLDTDMETTEPLTPKKKWGRSRSRQRSADSPRDTGTKEPAIISTKLRSVHMTQVDEAFIDFWSDAVTDPITQNWPSFVICGLKPLPAAEAVNWLIVEQTYVRQQRAQPRTTSPERRGRTSPRPSFRSDISGTFAATRKRLSLFGGGSRTSLTGKKSIFGKSPKVGELGEILPEEEERAKTPTVKARKNNGVGIVAASAVTAEAVQTTATSSPSQGSAPYLDAVEEPAQAAVEEAIPPAPMDVVLAGDTPGSQVALDTSESATPYPQSEASLYEESVAHATVEESISQPEPVSDVEEEGEEAVPEEVTSAPVSQADEGTDQSHEVAPGDVIEAAEPEVPEEVPVKPVVEPSHDQSPAAESKSAEQTNGGNYIH